MPTIISDNHDRIINRLIDSGKEKIIRKYRLATLKNQEGYIYPINIFVNFFWKINDEFCFSSLVVKLTNNWNLIITNEYGIIEEFSLGIFNFFTEVYD